MFREIGFTSQERLVILFLTGVLLIGLGVNFFSKRYSRIRVSGYVSRGVDGISLNQADKQALVNVPGIGSKLAQRIIDYRREKGQFRDIAELKNIKGIGESKYETLRGYFIIK